jgi:hypothetical protein
MAVPKKNIKIFIHRKDVIMDITIQLRPAPLIAIITVFLCIILWATKPEKIWERLIPRDRKKNRLAASAWFTPKSCSTSGRKGARMRRERNIKKKIPAIRETCLKGEKESS